MNRLFVVALALTCAMAGPSRAADLYADIVKPYLQQLAVRSVNGSTPRGMNPDPHFITMNPSTWYDSEQAAVSGFSWGNAPDRMIVGGAFRAYADGAPWSFGFVAEALGSPTSAAQIVGGEIDVASRNPSSSAAKWGLNVIFFNRLTGVAGAVESGVGANLYNENAKAVVIESLPRSPAGEFSGWQTGIYFGPTALDRTVAKPYAAAIDVSEVTSQGAFWYLVVFKCGAQRCGLRTTANGLEVWENIDSAPRLARTL